MSENILFQLNGFLTRATKVVRQEMLRQYPITPTQLHSWQNRHQRRQALEKNLRHKLAAFSAYLPKGQIKDLASSVGITNPAPFKFELAKAQANLEALQEHPILAPLARHIHHNELFKLNRSLLDIKKRYQTKPSPSLAVACQRLQQRIQAVHTDLERRLCQVEQQAALKVVRQSLLQLGYQVQTKGNAIRAMQGQHCIWAQLDEMGGLALDGSGFTPRGCAKAMRKIAKTMQQNGLDLQPLARERHGQEKGGVLAQVLQPDFEPFQAPQQSFFFTQDQQLECQIETA